MHCHCGSLQDLESFPTLLAMKAEEGNGLNVVGVTFSVRGTALLSL
jgi:hypothetical protein